MTSAPAVGFGERLRHLPDAEVDGADERQEPNAALEAPEEPLTEAHRREVAEKRDGHGDGERRQHLRDEDDVAGVVERPGEEGRHFTDDRAERGGDAVERELEDEHGHGQRGHENEAGDETAPQSGQNVHTDSPDDDGKIVWAKESRKRDEERKR